MARPFTKHEQSAGLFVSGLSYRIAFGVHAGQTLLSLRGAMPRATTSRPPLCADVDGFRLHAAVVWRHTDDVAEAFGERLILVRAARHETV